KDKIAYVNKEDPYFHPLQDTITGAWYYIQIEWRGSDHMFRVNVNGSGWTEWVNGYNSWTTGIDTIKLWDVSNVYGTDGVQFFDTIQENPLQKIGKTPVLIVPGVTGTELFNNSGKLWLGTNRMFLSLTDDFLDNLALTQNLESINSNVNFSGVLKK